MGKTWLAASIIRGVKRSAWVSFEPADAQGFAAWSYIVEALTPLVPGLEDELDGLLSQCFEREGALMLARRVANALADAPDTILVLDDTHLLFGSEEWLTILEWMRCAPETLHFVVTARQEPPDYLGDLALHGELAVIDHEAFRLTRDEARAVLRGLAGLDVSEELANRLIDEADGWIGALQMLAAAERLSPGSAVERRKTTEYLWQFLAREVVDALSAAEQTVLMVAAALPTCDASILQRCFPDLTMPPLLEALERRIPLLGRLRSDDETRRIHPQLRAFLLERHARDPERCAPALHLALQGYQEAGQTAAALESALLLGAEQSIVKLAKAVSSSASGLHYLLRVPRSLILADPEIALQRAFIHFARNEFDDCRFLLANFPANASAQLVETMRFLSSMFPARSQTGTEAMFLPRFSAPESIRSAGLPVAGTTRAIMLLRYAMELHWLRRPGPALRALQTLRSLDGWDSARAIASFALISEAQIREECGELERCLRLYDELLAQLTEEPDLAHLQVHVHLGRAGVLMKRFLLEEAEDSLRLGRPMAGGQPETLDAGFLVNEVELLLCRGKTNEATKLLGPLCAAQSLHLGSAHYLLDLDRAGGADAAVKETYRSQCDAQGLGELTPEELMLYARFSPDDPRSSDMVDEALARMRAD